MCKKIGYTALFVFKHQIMNNISSFINTFNSFKIINGSGFIALILSSNGMN